jgi:hypothetical protein
MNSNGEYEVRAQYGASKITSTFDFTSNWWINLIWKIIKVI